MNWRVTVDSRKVLLLKTAMLNHRPQYTIEKFAIMKTIHCTPDSVCINPSCISAIVSPTLVIGGEQDRALGAEPSRKIAAAISGAKLKMYAEWGHGLYEEAKDFIQTVLAFLKS